MRADPGGDVESEDDVAGADGYGKHVAGSGVDVGCGQGDAADVDDGNALLWGQIDDGSVKEVFEGSVVRHRAYSWLYERLRGRALHDWPSFGEHQHVFR